LDAFFAQHAFPPAKAGDAASIAAATTAVPRILIMVNAETGPTLEVFNLYSSMIRPCHSNLRIEKSIAKVNQA